MNTFKGLPLIALCFALVVGCTPTNGKDGLMGPSGSNGTNAPSEAQLAFDNYNSGVGTWSSYQAGVTPPTFSFTQSSARFTSPGSSLLLSTNTVQNNSAFYRSYTGGSGTVCARYNTYVTSTAGASKFEFVLGNSTDILALIGYDPNAGSNKVYLRDSGTDYPVADFYTGAWNTCEICVNLVSGKSSYKVNGVMIGQDYTTTNAISFPGQPASWFGVYLRQNANAWTANIDDLKIYNLQ